MPTPAIYLDECVDYRLARALHQRGFDVLTVQDAGNQSAGDDAQLAFATSRQRLFLSHNQLDFRRLHAALNREGHTHGGIVLIPQTVPISRLERRAVLTLDWVGSFPVDESRLFTWSDLQQHLIHGYRLPGWDESDVRDALGWR